MYMSIYIIMCISLSLSIPLSIYIYIYILFFLYPLCGDDALSGLRVLYEKGHRYPNAWGNRLRQLLGVVRAGRDWGGKIKFE